MYSKKTIQNLKPSWYLELPSGEKKQLQFLLNETKDKMWGEKPKTLNSGAVLTAKASVKSITSGNKYRMINYFATLVTTIYSSEWHEFVTLKNDNGYTVKMNLNRFDY